MEFTPFGLALMSFVVGYFVGKAVGVWQERDD